MVLLYMSILLRIYCVEHEKEECRAPSRVHGTARLSTVAPDPFVIRCFSLPLTIFDAAVSLVTIAGVWTPRYFDGPVADALRRCSPWANSAQAVFQHPETPAVSRGDRIFRSRSYPGIHPCTFRSEVRSPEVHRTQPRNAASCLPCLLPSLLTLVDLGVSSNIFLDTLPFPDSLQTSLDIRNNAQAHTPHR